MRSDGNYLNISSSDRVDLDVFLCRPYYFQYPDYELLNGKCSHLEVFSFARDLFAVFRSVLVGMYLNYTVQHFSDLISQICLSDEGKIIRRIFWFALDLLHKLFDINYMTFMSFLICLMKSIQVNVMLFVQINQNLDHMMDLNIP